ncbi:MAG TPA: hypothetical protein VKZ43_09200 [Trueperaceae bacterium]|nr:hypothetical protein [Trueperaceae bacterium]
MTRATMSVVSLGLLASGALVAAALLDVLAMPTAVRVPLVLLFLALGPGHGWILTLRLDNLTVEVALTAGLSLSMALGVSLTMAALDSWAPLFGVYILLGISLAGALLWFFSSRGRASMQAP